MYLIIVITYLILSLILVMRFVHEHLAQILRATSIPCTSSETQGQLVVAEKV